MEKQFDFMKSKLKKREKIAFGFGNLGGNLIYVTVGSFATLYYTDSVGISAAVVGTMMLITRLLDGVVDVFVGWLIDKTHTKYGKAKPWYLFSIIPLIVSFILVFNVPQYLGMNSKILYMYVTYIFCAIIGFTTFSMAYFTMQNLMTGNVKERISLTAISNIFGFISIILINMLTAQIATSVGWGKMAIIYSIIGFICLIIGSACKEKYSPEAVGKETEGHKVPLKVALPYMLKNRYFIIVIILGVINYLSLTTTNGVGVYYAINILGNPGLFGLLTLVGMLPTILFLPFVSKISGKFGKRNVLTFGYITHLVGYGIAFVANATLPIILTGMVIKGIGLAMISGLLLPLVGDVIDFGEMKTGVRLDGITNSAITVGQKVGTGLGGALVGWALAIGGYQAGLAHQGASALMAMRLLFAGIPAVAGILGIIFAATFTIEKHNDEISEFLAKKTTTATDN